MSLLILIILFVFFQPPIAVPPSGLRLTSQPIYRSIRRSLYPSYRSFGRLRPAPFQLGRRRFFRTFDDFNFDNNLNNNDGRLPIILSGSRRGFRFFGDGIIPRRIVIPARTQRRRITRLPLASRLRNRRVLVTRGSRVARIPTRRTVRRQFTARQSLPIRRPEDQVLALFALDDVTGSRQGQRSVGQPIKKSKVKSGVDLNLDVPILSEVIAGPTVKKTVPDLPKSMSRVDDGINPMFKGKLEVPSKSAKGNLKIEAVKDHEIKSKIIETKDLKMKIKDDKLTGKLEKDIPEIKIEKKTKLSSEKLVTVEKKVKQLAPIRAEIDIKQTEIVVDKSIDAIAVPKDVVAIVPAAEKINKVAHNSKDVVAIVPVAENNKETVSGAKDTVAIVPAADVSTVKKAEVTAKTDVKIVDADTVNIKASSVASSREGTLNATEVGKQIVKESISGNKNNDNKNSNSIRS